MDETKGQDDPDNSRPEKASPLPVGVIDTWCIGLALAPDGGEDEVDHLEKDDAKPNFDQETSREDVMGGGGEGKDIPEAGTIEKWPDIWAMQSRPTVIFQPGRLDAVTDTMPLLLPGSTEPNGRPSLT